MQVYVKTEHFTDLLVTNISAGKVVKKNVCRILVISGND